MTVLRALWLLAHAALFAAVLVALITVGAIVCGAKL